MLKFSFLVHYIMQCLSSNLGIREWMEGKSKLEIKRVNNKAWKVINETLYNQSEQQNM